jgi:S1-C subfamily serine protease
MNKGLTAVLVMVLGLAIGAGGGYLIKARTAENEVDQAVRQLRNFSLGFSRAANRVLPSVVHITLTARSSVVIDDSTYRPLTVKREERIGSGVVLDLKGYILTNYHVVKGVEEVVVSFTNGREDLGEIVGIDPETDLAVIKVKEHPDLVPVKFADPDRLRVGEWVIAIGNPYGLDHTVTAGVVGAVGRRQGLNFYEDLIQTDAAIFPGNSGGALVNLDGEVVGIISSVVTEGDQVQNIGFAINTRLAGWVADQLVQHGECIRGYLGAGMLGLREERVLAITGVKSTELLMQGLGLTSLDGSYVYTIRSGAAAQRAGLNVRDVIIGYNGQPIRTVQELVYLVAKTTPGTTVDLDVVRDKREMTIPITIDKRPTPQ